MIKVHELIAELQDLDPDAYVVIQKDTEGNGYRYCSGSEGGVVAIGKYNPDVKYKKLTSGLLQAGYLEEDCYDEEEDGPDYVEAVVLFP